MTSITKYAKLNPVQPISYKSIFSYNSASQSQRWSKNYGVESGFRHGEAGEWEHSRSFCDIAVNWCVVCTCYMLVVFSFPLSLFFCLKIISNYERLVIFRLGRMQEPKGPGPVVLLPCIDVHHRIDMRMRAFFVPPQTVLIKDGAGVEIGADVYFRTCDPLQATLFVQDLDLSIRALAKTTLINNVSTLTLHELQNDSQVLGSKLQKILNETCCQWGCEVGQVLISKPKVLQEPREESRHPGFGQLAHFLSGISAGTGNSSAPDSMSAIFQQLAPKLMGVESGTPVAVTKKVVNPPIPAKEPDVTEVDSSGQAPVSSEGVQIRELTRLFLGVLSGVLSEKLVRSIGSTYEITLEDLGPSGDSLRFFLDLKHGLGSVGEGPLPSNSPDACISLPASRFPQLLRGELSVFHAYMCGDLKVNGDTSAALKLEEVMTIMMSQIGAGKN